MASGLMKNAEGVHVGGLALIRRHSGSGIALDMFDDRKPSWIASSRSFVGDVILKIDEGRLTRLVSSDPATAPSVPS